LDVARLTELPEVRGLDLRLLVAPPIPNGGGNTSDRVQRILGRAEAKTP
jgi:hypothetical protein